MPIAAGCVRVARLCTSLSSPPDALTARPGHVKREVQTSAELSERCLVAVRHLIDLEVKLANQLADEDHHFYCGIIAVCVNITQTVAARTDDVAAKLNNRLRKDGLHGVREDPGQQTAEVEQMRLL